VFVDRCLRRILNVKCPDKISKEELRQRTNETPVEQQRGEGELALDWSKTQRTIERQALDCNPQGTKKMGRPRTTNNNKNNNNNNYYY